MNYFFSILYGLCCFTGYAQDFSAATPIPVGTGYGYNHPQIEVANDGLPLILWTSSSDYNLYLAKHDGVTGFNSPMLLSPSGFDVQSYNWSGPDLAIEGDNVYIVYRSYGYATGHVYLIKSTDNANTFGDTIRVDNLADGFGQYPDVAVYQDTVWVTFMDHDASGFDPQYVVARSTDGGATFEPEVAAGALTGDEACDCCQPEIIVDDERVIVFFRNNASNIRDIKAVISYDRGQTFTDWISVDDHNWYLNACPSTGPDARFIAEDTVVAVYRTEYNNESAVFINEYDLGNDVSNNLVQLLAAGASNQLVNYPQIAFNDNVLGVVWEGKGNSIDVFINSSSTGVGGLDSSNALNITDSPGSQSKPDIAIADGKFHVVYADYLDGELKYVQLDRFTEVNENKDANFIQVYPNPANDKVLIKLNQDVSSDFTLKVSSVSGEIMWESDCQSYCSHVELDVNSWPKGIYLVSVQSVNGTVIRKVSVL